MCGSYGNIYIFYISIQLQKLTKAVHATYYLNQGLCGCSCLAL